MNLFKEHAVRDYGAAAARIPVIDFGPVFGGAPGALRSVASAARHACENVGFFYALNHGVPEALIDRTRTKASSLVMIAAPSIPM